MRTPLPSRGRSVGFAVSGVLLLWLGAAAALGLSGALGLVPGLILTGVTWALVLAVLAGVWHVGPVYDWVERVHLRALVLPHAVRILAVLVAMVYLPSLLPYDLASSAAAAEVLVGIAALVISVSGLPIQRDWQWRAALAWNVSGLAGLVVIIGVAVHTVLVHPEAVAALGRFPGCLLPTFLLPLLLASHVLLFDRLRKGAVAFAG